MVKIANNSVLFQLNTLGNLPRGGQVTNPVPHGPGDLAQAHEAWLEKFSANPGSPVSICAQHVSDTQEAPRVALRNPSVREIDRLVKLLATRDHRTVSNTERVLRSIGALAIPSLLKGMGSKDEEVRMNADTILTRIDTGESSMVLDAIQNVLARQSYEFRKSSIRSYMVALCDGAELSVEVKCEINALRSAQVRGALFLLARLGKRGRLLRLKDVAGGLLSRLQDDYQEVRPVPKATNKTSQRKIQKIAETIQEKLLDGLNLESRVITDVSLSVVDLGVMRLGTRLEQSMELGRAFESFGIMDVKGVDSEADLAEHITALNCVVHHLVARIVQREREIPAPAVRVENYHRIEHKDIQLNANQIMLDRFAIDMAREIYAYNYVWGETEREAVAADAFATAVNIVMREHSHGRCKVSPACFARFVVVLKEIMKGAASDETQNKLQAMRRRIFAAIEREDKAEFRRIMRIYQRIFRQAKLPR